MTPKPASTASRARSAHWKGSCHCGNVRFSITWPAGAARRARRCGCDFCTKHGGVWTSNPAAKLAVRIAAPAAANRYAFATGTADFVVCARCGAVPLVTSEIDGRTYAVVNVNTFDGRARSTFRIAPATFDGENAGARLARRRRNWIADVRVAEGAP